MLFVGDARSVQRVELWLGNLLFRILRGFLEFSLYGGLFLRCLTAAFSRNIGHLQLATNCPEYYRVSYHSAGTLYHWIFLNSAHNFFCFGFPRSDSSSQSALSSCLS